jgi:hypothetical protein
MKIAYIISAYKYPEQLVRLIHRLNTETASFFVHIDKKTDNKLYHQIVRELSNFPNVYFLKRHKCYWGDFGHVLATIKGIQEVFNKNISFDYMFLLTGQDYPIKSNAYIEKTLQENKGKEFIKYHSLPHDRWEGKYEGFRRIDYWHFYLFNKYFCFPEKRSFNNRVISLLWSFLILLFPKTRKFPEGFEPFGGSGYWSLTRECVEYIHNFIKQNRAFVNFFKYVYIPDEMFFQTIILNSPFKDSVFDDDLRCIDWSGRNGFYPGIWCKDDMEILSKSTALIARKFDTTIDSEILDMIDTKLLSDVVKSL